MLVKKLCSRCKEIKKASWSNSYCVKCHNEINRVWRKTHPLSPEQKKKDICRSYAGVYLRRGKIKKGSCLFCGDIKTQMHHPNYDEPLNIEWLCAKHHKQYK